MFGPRVPEIPPKDISPRFRSGDSSLVLLDVREPEELAICRIMGALHIPMRDVPARVGELDRSKELVVFCHTGYRSMNVANWLKQQGFANVKNLAGGIDAWSTDVDTTIPRY